MPTNPAPISPYRLTDRPSGTTLPGHKRTPLYSPEIVMVSAVYHPAFQGFIPSIVEREALPRANSLFTASDNVLNLAGPIVSGALVAALRADWIIWCNAASFLVSGVVIWSIAGSPTSAPKQGAMSLRQVRGDLADGFRLAWSQSIVEWGTILFIFENFATNLVLGNMMYFLTRPLVGCRRQMPVSPLAFRRWEQLPDRCLRRR